MAPTAADNTGNTGAVAAAPGNKGAVVPIAAAPIAPGQTDAAVALDYFGPNFVASPQAMVLFAADFRVLASNQAMQRMTGHDAETSWVGQDISSDALAFDDPDSLLQSVGELFAGRIEHVDFDCELTTLNNAFRAVRISIQALRDPDGNVAYLPGFIADVTDLRRAENKLAKQLRVETALSDAADALVLAADAKAVAEVITSSTAALAQAGSAKRAVVWVLESGRDATMTLDWCQPGQKSVLIADRSMSRDAAFAALPEHADTTAVIVNATDIPGLADLGAADSNVKELTAIIAPVHAGEPTAETLVAVIAIVGGDTDAELGLQVLENLAAMFSRTRRAIDRRDATKCRTQYSRFINETGARFLAPSDHHNDDRIEQALAELGRLIGAHHVQLRKVDWETMESTVSVEFCDDRANDASSILHQFETIDLNDPGMREIAARKDPNQFETGDYNFDTGRDSSTVVLSVPLVVDDVVTATINAVAVGHGQFGADQIWMVHSIAGLIAQLQHRQAAESELEHRLELEDMVRTIAIEFNELTSDTIAAGIRRTLKRIGETLRVDRAALCRLDAEARTILLAEEWCRDQRRAVPEDGRLQSADNSATVKMLLKSTTPLFLTPQSVGSSLADLMPEDLQIVHIPVVRGGVPVLSINFEAAATRVWTDAELGAIRSISALVVQLDARVRAERSALRRLELEDLTRAIATEFLDLASESRTAGLQMALARLGPGIGADIVSLWRVDSAEGTCSLRMAWGTEISDEAAHVYDTRSDLALADLAKVHGAHVQTVDLGALPLTLSEATAGRAAYAALLEADGAVHGLIGFERFGDEPFSDEELGAIETVSSMLVQLEARLEAEEYFTTAFDNAPVGITMRDERGRLLACNRAFEEFIGARQDDMLGEADDRFSPTAISESDASLLDGASEEIPFRRADGKMVWANVSTTHVRRPDGHTKLILSHIEDTTERRQAVEQLEYRASHDELTGLVNRRVFLDELKGCLSNPPEPDQAAILLLDLDRFKVANDSLGHSAGDDILRTIANRLRFAVRPGDVVSRLGGDEFVVLLRGPVDELEATTVAERLLDLIGKPVETTGGEVQTTCSVGVAFPSASDGSIEDVMRHADAAMYQAKSRGRDRYVVFNQEHREALAQKIKLEGQLRIAIDQQRLDLFYQPEIELATGRILGAEGLIRWRHPDLGLLTAGTFIELAEESGMIIDLGRFVLNQACRQAAEWNADFPHTFMVRANVSARQLERSELINEVKEALRDADLPAEQLCLEITETALMNDIDDSLRILRALKDIGVRLAIDDFGTGFSSLAYLKRFPVDVLKIDQAFVRGLGTDPDDEAIVRSVLSMAKALDLDVVAEGIETDHQRQMLVEMGCFRGQGFGLVRPAHPADLDGLLRRGAIELGVDAAT